MKKSLLLLVPIMLVTLTGCDFIRTIAGRPTEEVLVKKRIEILKAEEEALQARIDSLALAREQAVKDSLALQDSLAAIEKDLAVKKAQSIYKPVYGGPEKLKGIAGGDLKYRYYIIVGVFRESVNARSIFNAASEKGYSPVLINTCSGKLAVGLAPTNSRTKVEQMYNKVRREAFCPKDAWVLVNE